MDLYKQQLNKIEQIRKLIGDNEFKLNLPQITVIGDQSSGKSSLLTELSGIPFPTNSGITTKCPIVVCTKYNSSQVKPIYTITHNDEDIIIEKDKLSNKILELQTENLKNNDINEKVIDKCIHISAEGKDFNDLVLVDLPGIISNGLPEIKAKVIKMIETYITPEETLILTITEAKQDDETAQALELAKEFDPDEERTIRILTKYDIFDSEESKERANSITRKVSNLSPHAIICRPNGKDYSSKMEKEKLSEHNLPKERSGIISLKKRLPELLCNLINTNMPNLKEQTTKILQENKKHLFDIGETEPDNTTLLLSIQKKLQNNIKNLELKLSKPIKDFRDSIRETENLITDELIDKFYEFNAFKPIFFQGDDTFNKVLEFINGEWKIKIDELYNNIETIIDNLFHIEQIEKVSRQFIQCITKIWNDFKVIILDKLKKSMYCELSKELKYKTLNHYITSKYEEKLIIPQKIIDKIIGKINKDTIYTTENTIYDTLNEVNNLETIQSNIKEIIETTMEENQNDFDHLPIEEQHKLRILAASLANWSVSHKNLTDNILSSIDSNINDEINNWINITLISDNTIKTNISENKTIIKKRKEYKDTIEKMTKCLTILNS
jgi:hypothetical protein